MLGKILLNYSPNFTTSKRNTKNIKYLVFHYTGMSRESKAISRLVNESSKVSCHYYIKRNGQIIPFSKEIIFQSVKVALNGCVDQEKKTEQISNEVNEKIQDIGKDSVPTKKIGEFILKALKERDKMGYVRFYGVFKKVTDPKEYKRIVDTLH